ncbi:MAG: DNA polymerase III subunit delta [Planctomycetes bacterium]|nr:DNA polymerase III subunit delta [Planctomycetota bacterium]
MDALPFLATANPKRQPIYVLLGDEDFLKRLARDRIISNSLGDADPSFAMSVFAGDKLDFSTIRNELDTLPFLAPCRVVIVENADPFVTEHRQTLEQYCTKPSSVGVLILDVKSFPETTKLAKALPDAGKISCKSPPPYKLPAWCVEWAKTRHNKKLAADASEMLVELVGTGMGLLDQELAKLASAAGAKPAIAAADVAKLVGRSKAADVFRIMDAVGEGKPGEALSILEDLFAEGEDPMAILGPLTAQLRKLAAVGRFVSDGLPLGEAMNAAKVPNWDKARLSCEKQVKHLGRRRLDKLTEWLTEINIGLKGGNPLPERVQVERLVVMLARPREDAKK